MTGSRRKSGGQRIWREAAVTAAILVAASLVTATVTSAQAPLPAEPSAENGRVLAQRLCSTCHIVSDDGNKTVPAGVPPFRAIAKRPGQTGARIREMLIAPPHQMPDMQLTRSEIDDLLAYLNELRGDSSQPPFHPDPGAAKPTYPRPS